MHLLMHARGIIQHAPMGWSAFSNVASLLRRVPLVSTYVPRDTSVEDAFYYPDAFKDRGGAIPYWYGCWTLYISVLYFRNVLVTVRV
jgi:hypothetical protein